MSSKRPSGPKKKQPVQQPAVRRLGLAMDADPQTVEEFERRNTEAAVVAELDGAATSSVVGAPTEARAGEAMTAAAMESGVGAGSALVETAAPEPALGAAATGETAVAEAEAPVASPAEVEPAEVGTAEAPAKHVVSRRSSPGGSGGRVSVGDVDVREIDGEVYVREGGTWRAAGDRVQMTIALTAMERHRLKRYAEENGLSLIDVLRKALGGLLD